MYQKMFSSISGLSPLVVSGQSKSGKPKLSPDVVKYHGGWGGVELLLVENHISRLKFRASPLAWFSSICDVIFYY